MPVSWIPASEVRRSRWNAEWPQNGSSPSGSTRTRDAPVTEAASSLYYDPDANLTAAQLGSAYVRRLSQSDRDLAPILQARALELAYYLYETNPLAKRILELTRDFVLGDDVQITCSSDQQSTEPSEESIVLDQFWHDPVNQLDLKLMDHVLELGLWGEQFWPVVVNPVDGSVRLGYLDPADVQKVIVDPQNVKQANEFVVRGRGGVEDQRYQVIRCDLDPQSPSYGRLIAPNLTHSAFFFAINKVSNATRGRSDLLCLTDWVDVYDQALFNEVDRSVLLKSFIYDVTIRGDQKAVDDYTKRHGKTPKPASVHVHTDSVKWEAVTPTLNSRDAAASADQILSYISSGAGIPKTWINGMMDVNLATATALSEPAIKRLIARQKQVRHLIFYVCTFVLDQAELHGRLPKRPRQRSGTLPEPWPLSVSLPAIRTKDSAALANTLQLVVNALVAARADGAIDVQVEQEALILLLGQLGLDVDIDGMRERIEAEATRREERREQLQRQIWGQAGQGRKPPGKEMPGSEQPERMEMEPEREGEESWRLLTRT